MDREFVSDALRTPLTVVKTRLQVLRKYWDLLDDEDRKQGLKEVEVGLDEVEDAVAQVEARAEQ